MEISNFCIRSIRLVKIHKAMFRIYFGWNLTYYILHFRPIVIDKSLDAVA